MEQLGVKVFIEEHAKTDVKKCSKVNMFKQKIMGKKRHRKFPNFDTYLLWHGCFERFATFIFPVFYES